MERYIAGSALLLVGGLLLPLGIAGRPAAPATRGLLLVANKGDHTLGIIDPESGRQLAVASEDGVTGHEVVASPDGRTAFVPIYGDSGVGAPGSDGRTIAVIDVATRRLVKTLDLGKPLRPHCAVFGPKDGLLYVTTELADSVTVIDPRTLTVVASIPTDQPESHMLAITRDGRRAYTSNVHVGTVSALDLDTRKVLAIIPVSKHAQRISLSADDRWAFTADQTAPRLAVIDTATNQVHAWIPLPTLAYGTAATLDGHWLLVTLPDAGKVGVVDLASMKMVNAVDVPKSPQEVLVRPDNQVAYVSCHESRKVAAIDLKSWRVDKLIEAGRLADVLAWAPGGARFGVLGRDWLESKGS
jgi:YVTN family beta-propeller protein